ncbi:LOW QUALITY PROTEIN: 6-phosphogluconate dehydrogenase, decarboxylating [Galemys pyrenaicus]|uniref:phosphogluconate dehydrogenase (NADP(+)-dependent, decarboxylating) n=1 Tax=Galemys pyrenaicus TaxID=202257 RepID=A0A8J5ZX63_GALPY|nr:LOW QUALITY PROTEIN: 6-phosphogluconate dehydrogenase, decarboxylating [Galemys pyrenaicus]
MAQADIAWTGLAVMGQNLMLNMNDHSFVVSAFNKIVSKGRIVTLEARIQTFKKKKKREMVSRPQGQGGMAKSRVTRRIVTCAERKKRSLAAHQEHPLRQVPCWDWIEEGAGHLVDEAQLDKDDEDSSSSRSTTCCYGACEITNSFNFQDSDGRHSPKIRGSSAQKGTRNLKCVYVWGGQGGSIIRIMFLGKIKDALGGNPELQNPLLNHLFGSVVENCQAGLLTISTGSIQTVNPMACLLSALSSYDGFRHDKLIQWGYLGAHPYELLAELGQFIHTDWTGHSNSVWSLSPCDAYIH